MYRIGDFSSLSQIPIKTLRHYHGIGLLRPTRVEPSTGYRYYTAAQLEQLNRILIFKDLGFSLREIRILIADKVPTGEIRDMVSRKHEELERSVDRERARLARAAARLQAIVRSGESAANEVAIRGASPRLVASVRGTLASHGECEGLFQELLHLTGGQRRRRQRGAIWHACADRAIDCEALVFLPSRIDCKGRVRVYELPAHRVASLIYRGDAEYPRAYRAMRAWIAASGVEVTGPKREIYLEDGGPQAESVTEIQFPIAGEVEPANVHSWRRAKEVHQT
jgi:DNA-binding transcriptional MerR regulator